MSEPSTSEALITATALGRLTIAYVYATYEPIGVCATGKFVFCIEDTEGRERDYYLSTNRAGAVIEAYRDMVGRALSVSECFQGVARAKRIAESVGQKETA